METPTQEPYKLGVLIDGEITPHVFERAYQHEVLENEMVRLKVTTDGSYVDLMIGLASVLPEPFGLLYVLVVPRQEQEPGRYRGPIMTRTQIEFFLRRYQEAFERDARHHLWLAAIDDDGQPRGIIVYDLHNVLFAYGPLGAFAAHLEGEGFPRVEEIEMPFPHTHHYNERYDPEVEAILAAYAWERSPLTEQDE